MCPKSFGTFEKRAPGARFSKDPKTLRARKVSRKSRKIFGPEKPLVKLRPANSVKLVFSNVVKGIKIKTTAKFHLSRRLRSEDTKRIMEPEMLPKSFRTFEKRAPGVRFSKDPKTLRARKAIRKTPTRLFYKAGLSICCKGNKN